MNQTSLISYVILKNLLGKSEDGTKEHISSELYNIKWGQSGDCPICGEVILWLSISFYNIRLKFFPSFPVFQDFENPF